MTLRRCSRLLTVRLNLRSAARHPRFAPDRRSTSPRMRRILFETKFSGVARMLCMCTPAGQEEFFMTIGDQVASRTSPPPKLSNKREARRRRAEELAPKYRTELLPP